MMKSSLHFINRLLDGIAAIFTFSPLRSRPVSPAPVFEKGLGKYFEATWRYVSNAVARDA